MFKTLIEKLRRWSHPDLVKQHVKRRLKELNFRFHYRSREKAKEGRKFLELDTFPEDDLDIVIEQAFRDKLEAEGFKIEVRVKLNTWHIIKISWRD